MAKNSRHKEKATNWEDTGLAESHGSIGPRGPVLDTETKRSPERTPEPCRSYKKSIIDLVETISIEHDTHALKKMQD